MAGQTVVSRNSHKTSGGVALADGNKNYYDTGPQSARQGSPIKNPFRRKRRWWTDSSIATKCFLVAFCCSCLIVLNDMNRVEKSSDGSVSSGGARRNVQQGELGELHLRPAFLTDDGQGDTSGDECDDEENCGYDDDKTSPNDDEDESEEEEKEEANGEGDEKNTGAAEEEDGREAKVRLRLSPSHRDRERRKIPRVLIFTHYKNLLELAPSSSKLQLLDLNERRQQHTDNNADADVLDALRSNPTPEQLEEYTLAVNVRHSIDVHNRSSSESGNDADDDELRVLFWTDEDCIRSLERTRPNLVSYFKTETEGMYKADICRGTALFEHGGFYLDVDVGVRHDLWNDLRPETEFVTARVHRDSNWVGKGFFQAVLGATPKSPVIERYLELFEKHYNGSRRISKGPLGVLLLKLAWDQVQEASSESGIATELYQEFLFHKNGPFDAGENVGVLSPAPRWGKRRACHFLVAGIANDPSNVEIVLKRNTDPAKENDDDEGTGTKKRQAIGLQIPVLSRIPGSRMCSANPDETDGRKTRYNATRAIEAMMWWERT